MPETPFYSKLMDRMKGRFTGLSFAECRKYFFDTLRWRRDCGAIGRIIRIDYLAAFFALRYLRIIRNSHSAHSSTMAAMMPYITFSQVGIPALESVA